MENDTLNLLRECNSGIQMGVSSIDSVLPYVKSESLKKVLNACKDEHATLGDETHKMLLQYESETKEPHPIAKMMSKMKTKTMVTFNKTDSSIADIMTDGCNMGIKSLNKYMNKYNTAKTDAKSIANRLICIEQNLVNEMKPFLT